MSTHAFSGKIGILLNKPVIIKFFEIDFIQLIIIKPNLFDRIDCFIHEIREKKMRTGLVFSLAALLAFDTIAEDKEGQYYGSRPNGDLYPIREDRKVVESVQVETKDDLKRILSDASLWGQDISDLTDDVYDCLVKIRQDGPRKAMEGMLDSLE